MRGLLAQLRLELVLLVRNGESLLLTLGIPVVLLVFFAQVDALPIDGEPIDFLAPGVLALAVLSTALVNLSIGVAFEREYGVLKRLGSTPLGRPRLLAAKVLAILVVEAAQIVVLSLIALALGWDPDPEPLAFLAAVVLGTTAFAGIGLVPGRPPPRRWRPSPLPTVSTWCCSCCRACSYPSTSCPTRRGSWHRPCRRARLAEAVRGSLAAGESVPGRAWAVLAAWAVAAPVAATRLFRWE